MTTRQTECKHEQDQSRTSGKLKPQETTTDIFVVVHSHSSTETPLTPALKREKFVTKRTKSLKDLFFGRKTIEKTHNSDLKTSQPSKTKIATLISKHFPLRFGNSNNLQARQQLDTRDTSSCPNIANRIDTSPQATKRYSNIPEVAIKRTDHSEKRLAHTSPYTSVDESSDADCYLNPETTSIKSRSASVPEKQVAKSPSESTSSIEFFTTSFTHSKKTQDSLPIHLFPKDQSRSAQDLQKSPLLAFKQKLVRSYSDTPPSSSLLYRRQRQILTLDTFRQSRMYRDDNVSQLLDYLFIGSVEAAYNQPLLCKLKIDSIVDMSNVAAADVPASKKTLCPCLCAEQSRHFRSRLIINIDDDEHEDISQYFAEINKFIDGVKQRGKKVLLFSYNGTSRAPAAAIQYLMSHENFLLRQAFNLVKNQRPTMSINQGFQKTLESVEHTLFPDEIPSVPFGNEYLNIADPQAIKCAWVDCSDM